MWGAHCQAHWLHCEEVLLLRHLEMLGKELADAAGLQKQPGFLMGLTN